MQKTAIIILGTIVLLTMAWWGFARGTKDLSVQDNSSRQATRSTPSTAKSPRAPDTLTSLSPGKDAPPTPTSPSSDLAQRLDAIFAIKNDLDRKAAFDRLLA